MYLRLCFYYKVAFSWGGLGWERVSANAPPAALSFPCLFGCLCWDVCLSASGEARRTCIKTSTRPIVTPKTNPYFSVLNLQTEARIIVDEKL